MPISTISAPQAVTYPGAVLQVVSAVITATNTTTSGTYVASNVTASITPKSATSKIYVSVSLCADTQGTNQSGEYTIYRNSTNIGTGQNNGFGYLWNTSGRMIGSVSMQVLDSPATTSATTYTVYYLSLSGTMALQNANASTITLMEIAA